MTVSPAATHPVVVTPTPMARQNVTGLVLAGGRGSRMGGADKGLLHHGAEPLAAQALRRLAPQVGAVAVNANRNLAAYAALGAPVWLDRWPDRPGPLAGFLAGLERCETPFLMTVPCDAPFFPLDLVDRLGQALTRDGADLAFAVVVAASIRTPQPVFCLMRTGLAADLRDFLRAGERRVGAWTRRQRHAEAVFDVADAFANLNTPDELRLASPDGGSFRCPSRS